MKQLWKKLGLIFCPDGNHSIIKTHASVPFILEIKDNKIKIFFSSRNSFNKSVISSLDFDLSNLSIINLPKDVLFEPGENGFFDYDGVMGCQLFALSGMDVLYYIGWNLGTSVPFRNAIGVAEYKDQKFTRKFSGPVLDRSKFDPCFVASCCVIQIESLYIMYYVSCNRWFKLNEQLNHEYNIKIATSNDGLDWVPTGKTAIEFVYDNEYAISVPRVIYEHGIYKMWYSYRGSPNTENYRIGYAESVNAFDWIRKDYLIQMDVSPNSWDSEMICYPYIFDYNNKRYMLYNGNGYGKTGFGLAVLENENNIYND